MEHVQQVSAQQLRKAAEGLQNLSLGRFAVSPELLKRIIPLLVLIFVIVIIASIGIHRYADHGRTLVASSAQLSLMADVTALKLSEQLNSEDGTLVSQRDLSLSLPPGATTNGRIFLATDTGGFVRATAPASIGFSDRALLTVLGPDQPLTTLGGSAGVMRLTLTDGQDVLATVRSLGSTPGQIAVLQPISGALTPWRRETFVLSSMLSMAAMVIVLLGLTFNWQTARAEGAEAMLLRTTNRLEKALNRGRCGLWDWDLSRGQVFWSNSMYDLLGMERKSAMLSFGELAELIHPDDADLYKFANAVADGEHKMIDSEFRLRHADGHWVWLRARAEVTQSNDEAGPHLVGISVDITDQKQMAAQNHEKDLRLLDAIENISEAFVLWDCDNRLVMCNSKYRQFYKLPGSVVQPGANYEDVVAAATEPVVHTRMEIREGDEEGAHTFEAQLEDGSWLNISERRTKDGGFVSIGTDITPLKAHESRLMDSERELMSTISDVDASRRTLEHQAQQLVEMAEKYQKEKIRAEAANRSKTEFLANMSHELRTPLNAIIGFSEVMQAGLFGKLGSEKYSEYARDILTSGQYLLDVINDILDMSKIEAGRLYIEPEKTDLAALVSDALRVVAARAEEENLSVINDIREPTTCTADKRALKQILLNILSNAVKFSEAGGEIHVGASHENGATRVCISDNGIGIAAEDLEKIGRPFEQVETQITKSRQGSGLGLAISRSLVELHAGTLEIDSTVGQGTQVVFTLPDVAAAPDPNSELAA